MSLSLYFDLLISLIASHQQQTRNQLRVSSLNFEWNLNTGKSNLMISPTQTVTRELEFEEVGRCSNHFPLLQLKCKGKSRRMPRDPRVRSLFLLPRKSFYKGKLLNESQHKKCQDSMTNLF